MQMYCSKCGAQNPDDAQVCNSCSSVLPKAPDGAEKIIPKTSGLAIAAFVLGILSLFSCGLTVLPAIILGIVGIIVIEKSGGRRTGRVFAVLAIIIPVLVFFAMLLLLLPQLNVKQMAYRMTCGKNLSEIGKAVQIYANDYDGEFPRSGGKIWKPHLPGSGVKNSVWAKHIHNWRAENRYGAYNVSPDGTGGVGNISSCLYLLVKYAGVSPKSFICQGDKGATEFKPSDKGAGNVELTDLWDFGPEPSKHCSYSYHMPFGLYALTTSSEPGMAVAADRNPWIDSPGAKAKQWPFFANVFHITKEETRAFNAITHQEDGQNVLFVDGHVGFEKKPFCGVNDDNIYTFWNGGDIRRGGRPWVTSTSLRGSEPQDRLDSLLVHDGQ